MMGSVRTSRYLPRSVIGTSAVMGERQSATLVRKFAHEGSNPAHPAFAGKLQQAANLANENCDRATALAHTLSAQLREAQNRINQLEFEADGLVDRLRAEAKSAVAKLQSTGRTVRPTSASPARRLRPRILSVACRTS